MRHIFIFCTLFLLLFQTQAQCPTQNIAGNFTPTNGQVLSGTYNITGVFHIPVGFTVFVEPQNVNNCGFIEINADSILIEGTLSAVGAGFAGGAGGAAGFCNDSVRFQDCSLASQCMGITPVTFGAAGTDGTGTGFGNSGTNGTNGSGRKNSCNATSDRVGRVGGSGGGGGGAGGSYGGNGGNAGAGAAATIPVMSANSPNNTCSPANTVAFISGNGGNGGIITTNYGTSNGIDFELGSGGGGAAGGGRGYFPAQNGEKGGNGGGAIKLITQKGLYILGSVLADGENGGKGGDGGDGGESPRCCIDACPQVNEHTYVGAGGGGAGGGGGSGGAIWLESNGSLQITGIVSANGGLAGIGGQGGAGDTVSYQEPPFICGTAGGLLTTATIPPASNGGNGGAGGGGRIKIFFDNCAWNNFSGQIVADSGGLGATNGSLYFEQKITTFAIGSISSNPNPQTICAFTGTANPLTAPVAATNYNPQYQWQMQTDCAGAWANIAGANSPIFVPTNLADTACFRLLVNSGNCVGIYQDTLQILTLPAPSYNLNVNTASFCANDSFSLSITGALPIGANIQWYQNGIPITTANGGTNNPLTVYNAGTYFAEISAAGLCAGNTDTATINVLPLPNPIITPQSSTTICAGGNVILNSSLANAYTWLINGSPVGSNSSTLTVASNGNITAQTTVQVIVQIADANNCVASSAPVTVIMNPNPTANLVNNGASVFCAGDSIILTASGGTTYSWLLNGVFNNNTNSTQTVTNSGNYSVEVINQFACNDTSNSITITVNPLPNGNINASNTTFCVGDSIMLVASGGGDYQWQAPIFSNNDTVYVSQNGTFCVNINNPLTNCSTLVCSPQISQAINPTADIQALNNTTICVGDTVHFNTTASLNNIWLFNGAAIAGQTGQNLSATQAGQYSVIAVFSQNCRDTSATLTVTIQPQITANILALTNTTLCSGDTAILTASGGNNYQWLTPSGSISQDTIHTSVAGDYQVIVTNNTGTCPDTSNIISLNFLPSPTPLIVISNGTNPFCLGDSLSLTCNGYVTYQWYQDGNILAGENSNSLTVYNAGAYSVSVTDANGCEGTSTDFLVQTSTLNTPIIIGDSLICQGQNANLQAAGNYSSYQWTLNGINLANTANITATQAGTYIVTVTFGTCVASSSPFNLNFASNPTVSIIPNGNIPVCNFDFPVLLTAFGANNYQWYKNNNLIGNATNDSLYVNSLGTYQVVGTNTEGCKDTSETAIFTQIASTQASIQANGSPKICVGDSLMLIANSNNVLAWLLNGAAIPNSAGQNPFFAKNEGQYQVVIADSCGNDTANIPVNVSFIEITADFSYTPAEVFAGKAVQFSNLSQSVGNTLWTWNFGDGNTSINKNPRHTYYLYDTVVVTLIATLSSGCADTVSKPVIVHTSGSIFFPNAFSPNRDGKNDTWQAVGIEITDFQLTIYDRWGRIITTFDEITDYWDGTKEGKNLPEGVYTYQYQVTFYDGRTNKGAGTISLLR